MRRRKLTKIRELIKLGEKIRMKVARVGEPSKVRRPLGSRDSSSDLFKAEGFHGYVTRNKKKELSSYDPTSFGIQTVD